MNPSIGLDRFKNESLPLTSQERRGEERLVECGSEGGIERERESENIIYFVTILIVPQRITEVCLLLSSSLTHTAVPLNGEHVVGLRALLKCPTVGDCC